MYQVYVNLYSLTKELEPYHPLDLTRRTEAVVCKSNRRKYANFYCVRVYAGISFHVACMSDPRLMPEKERNSLLKALQGIGYRNYLEEET
jgi:hypothetical protein